MVKDIYLAKIPFTDGSGSKPRPILLIKKNSYGDFIFLPLTTKLKTKGITVDRKNITDGYLPLKSVIVIEKISVISSVLLLKKICTLNKTTHKRVINEICNFIKN